MRIKCPRCGGKGGWTYKGEGIDSISGVNDTDDEYEWHDCKYCKGTGYTDK